MPIETETLPMDVIRDDAGRLMRRRKIHRGFMKADGDVWQDGDDLDLIVSEMHDIVMYPCMVGSAFDSDEEIQRKREQAIRAEPPADFLHPKLGWLRKGIKREQEWPQNMGEQAGEREHELTPVTMANPKTEMKRTARKAQKESANV